MESNHIVKDNKGLFKVDLSSSLLKAFSSLLHSQLDDRIKDDILKLILMSRSDEGSLLYCSTEEAHLADLINHFFLNQSLNEQEVFCELVSFMKDRKLNSGFIHSYVMLGKVTGEVDATRVINWAKKLVNLPSDWHQNYWLISALLKDDRLLKDIDRLDLIVDVLSQKKATYDILNGEDTTPFVVEVLANDAFDFSKRNNVMFRKVVEFATTNLGWHFVSCLLKQGVKTEKIGIAVDYYRSLYDHFIREWDFVTWSKLGYDFDQKPLYQLPIRLSGLETSMYASRLEAVQNSSNPLSHAMVEASDISVGRKQFAIELIDGSDSEYDIESDKPVVDYLNSLAVLAVTPLAQSLTIDHYKELLRYMKDCILMNKTMEKEEKSRGKCAYRYLCDSSRKIPELFTKLFVAAPFMAQNQERLQYLIELIQSISGANYYVEQEVVGIATSINAMYYGDEEFKELVGVVREIHDRVYRDGIKEDQEKYFSLMSFFTNSNVPFMDRHYLFEFARNETSEEVEKMTRYLEMEGLANRNIAILSGDEAYSLGAKYVLEKK